MFRAIYEIIFKFCSKLETLVGSVWHLFSSVVYIDGESILLRLQVALVATTRLTRLD
jgi:hypothetical protein